MDSVEPSKVKPLIMFFSDHAFNVRNDVIATR